MGVLNLKVYGQLTVNGIPEDFGHTEVKNMVAKLGHRLMAMEVEIKSSELSTITFKLSRRVIPLEADAEMDQFMKDNAIHVNQVHEDDLIEGTEITWGQYESLRQSIHWVNMKALTTEPDKYTESEAQSIRQAYDHEFKGTAMYGVGIKL